MVGAAEAVAATVGDGTAAATGGVVGAVAAAAQGAVEAVAKRARRAAADHEYDSMVALAGLMSAVNADEGYEEDEEAPTLGGYNSFEELEGAFRNVFGADVMASGGLESVPPMRELQTKLLAQLDFCRGLVLTSDDMFAAGNPIYSASLFQAKLIVKELGARSHAVSETKRQRLNESGHHGAIRDSAVNKMRKQGMRRW